VRLKLGAAGDHDDEKRICEQLNTVTAQCKKNFRTQMQVRNENLIDEIWLAWHERESARVYRLSFLLAGGRYGPRKRDYSRVQGSLPTAKQWMDVWSLPGGDGGMEATQVNWDDMVDCQLGRIAGTDLVEDPEKLAVGDLHHILKYLCRAPKRRGVPMWVCPVELLQMCLCLPSRSRTRSRLGVGAREAPPRSPAAVAWLQSALVKLRRTCIPPLRWSCSHGFPLK